MTRRFSPVAIVVTIAITITIALAASACERPRFTAGEGCEINTDCANPLVCVFGACRRQCVDSRDCGAGLRCLNEAGSELGGGCQLESEAMCTLTSECRATSAELVCQNGSCTTPCVEHRDCARGATCERDAAGVLACHEAITESCVYNTDCPAPRICWVDQSCRFECFEDRDCSAPRTCVENLCELPDGGS